MSEGTVANLDEKLTIEELGEALNLMNPALIKHQLVQASSRLQEKICSQHDEVVKIYCRTDQSCICYLCTMHEHKGHDTVAAAAERTEKQNQLEEVQRKSQQRLQQKEKKLQELKQAVVTLKGSSGQRSAGAAVSQLTQTLLQSDSEESSVGHFVGHSHNVDSQSSTVPRSAQAAVEDSERIFTELIRSIEKKRSEVTKLIRTQEKNQLRHIEELQENLQQDIDDLKRRNTELEQLSVTEDHIQFLQSFQSLRVSAGCEDSSSITVHQHPSFDGVRKSLSDLKERLEEFCKEEFRKISPHAAAVQTISSSEPRTRADFLQSLIKHQLVQASSRLQEKICSQHDEVVKIYCRTDQSCICYLCTMHEHKGHDTVAAAAERTEKQNQLKKVQKKSQQRLQQKEKKLQELKQAVVTLKRSAQAAVEDSERIFIGLIRSIEKKRSEVTKLIRTQEKNQLRHTEELLENLQQEIDDLKRRNTELEQLSVTEDHIHFLQSFQSLSVSAGCEDSSSFTVHQHPSFDGVRKSLSELKERLEEFCKEEFRKISPHALIKHQLVKASSRLQEKICSQHGEVVKIYCRTDQSCICYLCTMHEHKGHDTVAAAAERTEKQNQLKKVQKKSHQRLQQKEKKLQELKQAMVTLKRSAQAAVEDSERIFTELIRSIEKKRSEVTELIRTQEKNQLRQTEELLENLQQDIDDLKRRNTELEQLSVTEDHIQFLQSFQSLRVSAGCEDSSSFTVHQHPSFDGVRKSLSDLKERLEEFCKEEFRKITPHAAAVQTISFSEPRTREDFLQYFCRLTLDPNTEDQRGLYSCPQCRETFTLRPVLRRNNMLAEVVEKVRKPELQAASPAHCYAGPGDVESLIKHQLVKASSRLQEKICSQHDEVVKIYCRTDQSCICYLCTMHEHKGHDTVAAAAERTEKQNQLEEVQKKSQQRLQQKEKKLQELKQAVVTFKRSAQAAVEDNERIFTELIRSIEKKRSEVTELIRTQEKNQLRQTEELLENLQQEIDDLKRRNTELEQLSVTEDHIQFLQSFQSLRVSAGCEDSSSFTVHQHPSFDGVRKSLSELKDRLEEFCKEEFRKISPHAAAVQTISSSEPRTRADFLQYFCPLTLDPNTVHHYLILVSLFDPECVSERHGVVETPEARSLLKESMKSLVM
ncbi:hypothetical protein SRHO_G00075300 [Serrasalmus rhombeus]